MRTPEATERETVTEYVVGVDGTAASIAAAQWAAERARRDGTALVVVHAYQVNSLPSVAGPVRTAEMRHTAERHAQQTLGAVMRLLPAGSAAEPLLIEGPADRVLIERSVNAGLLVLGARPQHTHPRMRFLGTVALRCLRGAQCPVVMVPQAVGKPSRVLAATAKA